MVKLKTDDHIEIPTLKSVQDAIHHFTWRGWIRWWTQSIISRQLIFELAFQSMRS